MLVVSNEQSWRNSCCILATMLDCGFKVSEFKLQSCYLCRNAAAMNFANQFLNDMCVNKSASFSLFPFLFLPSFSLFHSLLPSSFNRLHAYASIDSPRKKMTPSSGHRAFICSPNLERICIHANRLLLVRDHPMLHIVLEAAISVSCLHSTGQRNTLSNIFVLGCVSGPMPTTVTVIAFRCCGTLPC